MSTITIDMVSERLKLYQTELQQAQNLIKLYDGAIQDCTFWLNKLKEDEQEKEKGID